MKFLAALVASVLLLAPFGARAADIVTQRVSGKRIAMLAARELAGLSHEPNQDFVPVSLVPDQVVSDGHVDLRAQSPVGGTAFVNVPVQIEVNGHLDRTVLVGYRVEQYVQTAVAAHDLTPGTVLSEDDLRMERVPFEGRAGNGIDALVGRRLNAAVVEGQPVAFSATSVNQIVKPGSTVMFVIRDDGVAVSADAIARTGGGLGDQVFVYNPATHKALSGVVTGPGTVELDISGGTE
jgi:flagella basal body P-ring formation protein FlgA